MFRLNPSGKVLVLHPFGTSPFDGAAPYSALAEGPSDDLFGTTTSGGTRNGTVFSVNRQTGLESIVTRWVPRHPTACFLGAGVELNRCQMCCQISAEWRCDIHRVEVHPTHKLLIRLRWSGKPTFPKPLVACRVTPGYRKRGKLLGWGGYSEQIAGERAAGVATGERTTRSAKIDSRRSAPGDSPESCESPQSLILPCLHICIRKIEGLANART